MMNSYEHTLSKWFTLLEILLMVATIAILAGIVIVAINPGQTTAERAAPSAAQMVTTILNGVYQYTRQ